MQSTKQQTACQYCGNDFLVFPSELARGNGKYCNRACSDSARVITVETRFWKYVQKTDSCWLWTGFLNDRGYGQFHSHPGDSTLAHRASWKIHNGPIPDGMFVLHDCPGGDNPACVNPAHLWLGNHADNMRDMTAKGRSRNGEHATFSKLTEAAVSEIRTQYASGGITQAQLAKKHGMSKAAINHIVRGLSWKHSGSPETASAESHRERGEKSRESKLTAAAVLDIRARFAAGNATQAELAQEHDVTRRNINDIIRGATWKHLL